MRINLHLMNQDPLLLQVDHPLSLDYQRNAFYQIHQIMFD